MLYNPYPLFNYMPSSEGSKPPIIVISNSAAGGTGGKGDKEGGFKLGNMKVNTGMLINVASVAAIGVVGLYVIGQMPAVSKYIDSLFPPPQDVSGAPVSGVAAPIPPADVTTYPGTGAGSFPAPAVTQPAIPGVYANTTQGYPIPTPYATSPSLYQATQTPMPTTALGSSVVRSYHAHITDKDYLDHRGKRRSFINELRIEEVIGSEQDSKRVLSLNEV
jgi:hypothetical protein